MAYYNDKKVLSVVKVVDLGNVVYSFVGGYVKVLGNTFVTSENPIVNKVIDNELYSFNSSVSGNALTIATASISGNTITI